MAAHDRMTDRESTECQVTGHVNQVEDKQKPAKSAVKACWTLSQAFWIHMLILAVDLWQIT